MDTQNLTALVTGTSSGIGHATALALREAGFHVIATAPDISGMQELESAGCEVRELDVTDGDACRELISTAVARNGFIYALVNNAGYGQYGPIEEIPLDDIREQFEVNVFGLIRLTQLVAPGMREAGRGRIINISSVAGEIKQPGTGIYHATKHAVEAIDGSLRVELGHFGIDVIGVLPGPVDTNFGEVAAASIPQTGLDSPYAIFSDNLRRMTLEMHKPEATGVVTAEDVAAIVVEAATSDSPDNRYHVGMMSKAMSTASAITPDSIWDKAMEYRIPMDERKEYGEAKQ
jgi:short-subunit dehydrogenase